MSDYEEILKEIKKSINGGSAYMKALKSIELEVQKCGVSLKKVREAITPLMRQLLPKSQFEEEFGEWTDEEYEEEIDWFVGKIARFYRDFYNSKEQKMIGFNGDGSRNIPLMDDNGEYINYDEDPLFPHLKDNPYHFELMIRNSVNSKGLEEMVMPTKKDLVYMNDITYNFMVKVNRKGLTITKRNGEFDSNNINFQAPLMNRADKMFSESWRDKANNGISDIVADRKAKKITNEQAQAKIRDALINQANDWADKESKNLTKDYANVGIPIETYYVPIN